MIYGLLARIAGLEADNVRLTAMVMNAQHALDEVGAGIARRVAEEREACARLAEPLHPQHFSDWTEVAKNIADAIRARPAP